MGEPLNFEEKIYFMIIKNEEQIKKKFIKIIEIIIRATFGSSSY